MELFLQQKPCFNITHTFQTVSQPSWSSYSIPNSYGFYKPPLNSGKETMITTVECLYIPGSMIRTFIHQVINQVIPSLIIFYIQ